MMKVCRFLCLALVLALAVACSAYADIEGAAVNTVPDPQPWSYELGPIFQSAAAQYNVPLPLLLTLAHFGSAFENRGDQPTIEGGYGVMALRANNQGGNSLALAATLTHVSQDDLKTRGDLNIMGAAAVLDSYAKMWQVDRTKGLDAWLSVIVTYAGLDPENSRFFAMEVYEKMMAGLDHVNSVGERFTFSAQDIGSIDLSSLEPPGARVQGPDYGPAIWDPAASCNYSTSTYTKKFVVCHTIEGTAAGARSWLKNCSAQVSAHYVVSEAGGVWQCVRESQTAWHVSCMNSCSVGIEHEGYAASSSHPQALYDASALLTRDICNRWGIPKVKTTPAGTCGGSGIVGHIDITRCCCGTHTDPGNGWNWTYYIQQVTGTPPTPEYAASYNAQSYPSSMVAGSTATAWVEYKNNGTATWTHGNTRLGTSSPQDRSSPFYNSGNWIGANRPTDVDQSSTAQGAIGRFTFILKAPSTPGTYVEKYKLVQEGVTWFGDEITWTITVTASTGNITGTVRNAANGQALSGATVAISGGPSTTTDAAGSYTLVNVGAGAYTVTASKAGFASSSASVTVNSGQTATQNFNLTSTDNTAPTVPANLTATSISPSEIDLSWSASTDSGGAGLAGYIIYRGGSEVGRTTATTYADNGLAQNTNYSYYVKAYDGANNISGQSNTASASTKPGTVPIFQDGFANANYWQAQQQSPMTSPNGLVLDATYNHGAYSGGNSYMAVYSGDGNLGTLSGHTFSPAFAAAKYETWFYDTSASNNSRQGLQVRCLTETGGIKAIYYVGTYSAAPGSYSTYSIGYYKACGTGCTGWYWQGAVKTRTVGWHKFTIDFQPYTGAGNEVTFYIDDAKVGNSVERTLDTQTYGLTMVAYGYHYGVNQTGWFDDCAMYASPPVVPTMGTPTALSETSIRWNITDNSNNEMGFKIQDAAQTTKAAATVSNGSGGAVSMDEVGLTANTAYTRFAKAFNGTLDSLPSANATRWTLSRPPSAANVTCNHAAGSPTFTFSSSGGFGGGSIDHYLWAWDNSPTHSWTGSEATWNSGALIATASVGNYYLHVKGYNGENVANGTLDLGPYSFDDEPPTNPTAVAETHGVVSGQWQSTDAIPSFTWTGATDASGIAGYDVYFGPDESGEGGSYQTSAAYTGSAVSTGAYYLRVRSRDGAGNSAIKWQTLFAFQYDSSAPEAPAVSDDGAYSGSKSKLHASWFAVDPDSGVAEYQYAVGTSAGASDVVGWTSVGSETEAVIAIPEPGMQSGQTYYVSAKAKNNAGLWSEVASSDGIGLAPDAGTVSAAKALADGTPVALSGKVVTATFLAGFYVEELNRTSGILVLGPGPSQGALVSVGGTMGANALGERAILDPVVVTDAEADPLRIPGALFMSNSALGGGSFNAYTVGKAGGTGLNTVGLLVKVCGSVVSVDENGFTMTDGSAGGAVTVVTSQISGVSVAEGDYVSVVGICTLQLNPTLQPLVRVRDVDDVKKLN